MATHDTGGAASPDENHAGPRDIPPPMHPPFQHLSRFEEIITHYPPILATLILHLPTDSLLQLYCTSQHLRRFLSRYPLAWHDLSFRRAPSSNRGTDGTASESPERDASTRTPFALDFLLQSILPIDSRLTKLELDNTAISGAELYARILVPRRAVLKHLSVRGCKEVSLKYHILPFLNFERAAPKALQRDGPLALQSLYAYRVRHHRRRPYINESLHRRDSDSSPTHALIELCHELGIYTDSGWCPTPGPRCFRRKDYYKHRFGNHTKEVWVPFDRLWRSKNFAGAGSDGKGTLALQEKSPEIRDSRNVCLWQSEESGYGGEALGSGITHGDPKPIPTHLRRSHRVFVEKVSCDHCKVPISERCEQCSVRMHCHGCRKTLCASCAFDRPLRRRQLQEGDANEADAPLHLLSLGDDGAFSTRRRRTPRPMWWAPDTRYSPNTMNENLNDVDSSDDEQPHNENSQASEFGTREPSITMWWCCARPLVSVGGDISCPDARIRAAPLPARYDTHQNPPIGRAPVTEDSSHPGPDSHIRAVQDYNTASLRAIEALIEQDYKKPRYADFQLRNLCQSCHNDGTRILTCPNCHSRVCVDHHIKLSRARRCGSMPLTTEKPSLRKFMKLYRERSLRYPIWTWGQMVALRSRKSVFEQFLLLQSYRLLRISCKEGERDGLKDGLKCYGSLGVRSSVVDPSFTRLRRGLELRMGHSSRELLDRCTTKGTDNCPTFRDSVTPDGRSTPTRSSSAPPTSRKPLSAQVQGPDKQDAETGTSSELGHEDHLINSWKQDIRVCGRFFCSEPDAIAGIRSCETCQSNSGWVDASLLKVSEAANATPISSDRPNSAVGDDSANLTIFEPSTSQTEESTTVALYSSIFAHSPDAISSSASNASVSFVLMPHGTRISPTQLRSLCAAPQKPARIRLRQCKNCTIYICTDCYDLRAPFPPLEPFRISVDTYSNSRTVNLDSPTVGSTNQGSATAEGSSQPEPSSQTINPWYTHHPWEPVPWWEQSHTSAPQEQVQTSAADSFTSNETEMPPASPVVESRAASEEAGARLERQKRQWRQQLEAEKSQGRVPCPSCGDAQGLPGWFLDG